MFSINKSRCLTAPDRCSSSSLYVARLLPVGVRNVCQPTTPKQRKEHVRSLGALRRASWVPASLGGSASSTSSTTATKTTEQTPWWKKETELWVEVHDAAGWEKEIAQASTPVVVDWYASWCTGCQRSYPEVCKVLRNNPDMNKHLKFVKVCVDDFPKAFTREQGITALPRMTLYRPGHGRVLTWDIPVSRIKYLKQNLNTIVNNPNSALALDPNSFIVATGPMPTQSEAQKAAAKKAAEIAALESRSGSLFDHLSKVAQMGGSTPAKPSAATASSPAAAATSYPNGSNGHSIGNGHSAGAMAARPVQATASVGSLLDEQPVSHAQLAQQYVASYVQQYGQSYSLERQMFLRRAGEEYGYGGRIDELYPREVGVRMQPVGPQQRQQHYLDYTGSSVYTQSQLDAAFKELSTTMFGNPHAQNPSSELASQKIEEVRAMVLQFFNADPAEWQLVFTRSATGALKLVGETFPWSTGSLFRYLRENHNSVLGVREYALQAGGAFQAVDEMLVEEWLHSAPPPKSGPLPASCKHDHMPGTCTGINAEGVCPADWDLEETDVNGNGSTTAGSGVALQPGETGSGASADEEQSSATSDAVTYSLFAYPAEDNFFGSPDATDAQAGVKYPLSWAAGIKARSTTNHKWMVMIDAAAYVPTQPLDLSTLAADFVDLSFYKIFGYPTGLGALLVRTEAVEVLRKVFWGGGSVALATSNDNFHVLKCRPTDKLEDGTVAFLDIIALKHGFHMLQSLGGINRVNAHVACLTEWLYDAVSKLRHSNGRPMVKVFGKHSRMNHREVQGGILNFEVLSPQGVPLSYKAFERDAAVAGFHVRTGAECNPGACYAYLGIPEADIEALAGVKEGCGDDVEFITIEKPGSANERPMAVSSADQLKLLASAQRLELGHPAEVASKWIHVPLGSVRASLGWMSTFEDCYTFVDFISSWCKDRQPEPLDSSQVAPGASAQRG